MQKRSIHNFLKQLPKPRAMDDRFALYVMHNVIAQY
jgi:hypothetical protein